MNSAAKTILTTPRLVLAELQLTDAAFILALLNEPLWLRFIGDRGVRTTEHAMNYLTKGPLASYARHGFGLWGVRLKADATPIGICGLIKRDTLDDVDVGFALLAAHSGRGYATEAARACVEYGFNQVGLKRIVGITDPQNRDSIHVLEKTGLRFERTINLPGYSQPGNLYALASPLTLAKAATTD